MTLLSDGTTLEPGDRLQVIAPLPVSHPSVVFAPGTIITYTGEGASWGDPDAIPFFVRSSDSNHYRVHVGATPGPLDPAMGFVERLNTPQEAL